MWIFTKLGFVSAVLDKDDPDTMMVRARERTHLETLLPGRPIVELSPADYPFRAFMPKAEFVEWLTKQAEAIDYPDFKSAIPHGPISDTYYQACSRVWGVMHDIQR